MKRFIPVLLILLWSCAASASTADDISKNVNKLIRSAEKEFFSGKTNDAASILQEAVQALNQLKSEDPEHRSLKTLQRKYDRLKAKVDKKLGNSTSSAAPGQRTTSAPSQSGGISQDLSRGAKSNLKRAGREMDFAERELGKSEKSLQKKKFNMVDSYIYNASSRLESAGNLLDKVVNNNKANPEHPDVVSAFKRHKDMGDRLSAFKNKAQGKKEGVKQAATLAKEDAAKFNEKWLPEITAFTDTSSDSRLQYPGSYNAQELARQDALYVQAKKVLVDVDKNVPAGSQPHELKNAVDNLRFALKVYEDEKKADNRNRLQPIENTLSSWEKRFEQNKKWTQKSDQGLFIITKEKLEHQKKQIAELGKVSTDSAAGFNKRLAKLKKENSTWVEKKRRWMERPRPFPEAKMRSAKLETDMRRLLKDRGIKVEDLVITDKDWWVQQGEFRYVMTAVLSKDKEGKYWSNISFRQMKTLTGYGPTEIYDIDEIRVRMP